MISYACSKCNWGDWSPIVPAACPHCGGTLHQTDSVKVVEL